MSGSQDVHSSQLFSLSLLQLEGRDVRETRRLFEACSNDGFFYLDLRDHKRLLSDYEALLGIMKEYFAQSLDEKMKDDHTSDTIGYEPVATSAGVLTGLPDYYESFKVSWDQLTSGTEDLPSVVTANLPLFGRFTKQVHNSLMTILSCLSDAVLPHSNERFEASHRKGSTTRTNLTVLKYPKQESAELGIGHNRHTDIGTLTFLTSDQRGLQILTPDGWRYVEPRPGFAVVNVGDSLRFLSKRLFRSVVHRVLPIGPHQTEDRYTVAFFLRPEDEALFEDARGQVVSAKTWHDRKFDHFREPHDSQNIDCILTGGMEEDGKLLQRHVQAEM
uniref:OXY3 n=1 Tax=Phialomyces arenicola TaxID=168477 RepID=A0A6H0XBE2_9EURO|nr:OXY3 [Phialomyces arenicola]